MKSLPDPWRAELGAELTTPEETLFKAAPGTEATPRSTARGSRSTASRPGAGERS
ncbi:hypothetical protein WME75_33460 [Sorangium sp. So ce1014]|uniref:hypothetical protein n=1 Tax=Sorangium sp. So ce1014 TaxID=3133326 RepID=UPI003F5F709F